MFSSPSKEVIVLIAGVVVMATSIWLARRTKRARARTSRGFVEVNTRASETDALLRYQLETSAPMDGRPANLLQAITGWATGATDATRQVDALLAEVKALKAYVLHLDDRYLRQDAAVWLILQVIGLVFGVLASIIGVAWALIELVG